MAQVGFAFQSLTGGLTPYEFESITVGITAVGLAAAKIEPNSSVAQKDLGKAKLVRISVETDKIRFREDGLADPTSAIGHELVAGDYYYLSNLQQMKNFKAIRSGAADATLRVTYFR